MYTGAGDAVQRAKIKPDQGPEREALYHIWWKKAQIEYGAEQLFGGQMATVRGEIFDAGVLTSTFTADSAIADKITGVLKLSGNVHVHAPIVQKDRQKPKSEVDVQSKTPERELVCNRLEWYFHNKIEEGTLAKAIGNVVVKTESGGQVGPVAELWSTPDLSVLGTPEAFKNR